MSHRYLLHFRTSDGCHACKDANRKVDRDGSFGDFFRGLPPAEGFRLLGVHLLPIADSVCTHVTDVEASELDEDSFVGVQDGLKACRQALSNVAASTRKGREPQCISESNIDRLRSASHTEACEKATECRG